MSGTRVMNRTSMHGPPVLRRSIHRLGPVAVVAALVLVAASQTVAIAPASALEQSISGSVALGAEAAPAAEGEVVVTARHHLPWGDGSTDDYTTRTDAAGRYSFPSLPRGVYELGFDYVGADGFADQWWPGNPVPSTGATRFPLDAEPLVLDMILPLGASLAGAVRDSAGLPIADAGVEAAVVDPSGFDTTVATTRTGADGGYAFEGLAPGPYALEFRAGDGFEPERLDDLDLRSGDVRAGVDATLYRPTSLQGRIACAGCGEQGTAQLLTVHLERAAGEESAPEWVEVATATAQPGATVDEAAYRIDGLAPGTYRAQVGGSLGWTPTPNLSPEVTVVEGDEAVLDLAVEFASFDRDFSGDGAPDVLVRTSEGALRLYAGDGASGWAGVSTVGSGWTIMDRVFSAGDFSGDGHADVLARDTSGRLHLYRGDGAGGWLGWSVIGSDWGRMTAILSPGDFSGDGRSDVLARDASGGLWLYSGNGAGGFGDVSLVGTGWNAYDQVFATGDFGGHGGADVMGRDGAGRLIVHPSSGDGGWADPVLVGSGWGVFDAVFGSGDFNGDGTDDVMGRDAAGRLWLYPGDGRNGWGVPAVVGTGWGLLSFVS